MAGGLAMAASEERAGSRRPGRRGARVVLVIRARREDLLGLGGRSAAEHLTRDEDEELGPITEALARAVDHPVGFRFAIETEQTLRETDESKDALRRDLRQIGRAHV